MLIVPACKFLNEINVVTYNVMHEQLLLTTVTGISSGVNVRNILAKITV